MSQAVPAPRVGAIVTVDRRAAPQVREAIRLRVHAVQLSREYPGWAWLHGVELDLAGAAAEPRAVFVNLAGLYRPVGSPPPPSPWRRAG